MDLHTTNGAAGMVETATVFANQAQAAGVKINVINDPNYYGNQYLKLAFSIDFWGTRSYLNQVQQGSLPNSPYNETHWPPKSGTGSNFESLYNQALADHRRDQAHRRSSTRCRQARVQHRRVHHPVLRRPHRRLRGQREGAQAEQGHPQPG